MRKKLTLVAAPPGYGKSFLLAQWAGGHRGVPLAWLALRSADDNAVRLAQRLVAALEGLEPDLGQSALERLEDSGSTLGDNFLYQLSAELAPLEGGILVVDDLGSVTNRGLLEELGALIERVPAHFHVVASGRSSTFLPLKGLWADDDVAFLDAADLAFDEDEARTLLRQVTDRTLADGQVGALVARTEGWPAGLQVAAVALRGERDVDGFIERFSGADQHVAAYLTQEVVARQPDWVRRFLLDTAVLHDLSGPLCDAVTAGHGSREILDRLERDGLFVQRSDTRAEWFRYQGLFRDLLRHQLRVLEPGAEARLLRRAADWHLDRGEVEVAAAYLIEAEDWDRVLHLVERHGRSMFEANAASLVLQWLEAVPAAARSGRRVALQRAVLHAMVGNFYVTDQVLHELEGRAMSPGERAVAKTVESVGIEWHLSPAVAVESADTALDLLTSLAPDDIPDVLGMAPGILRLAAAASRARALWHLGETEAAREAFAELAEDDDGYPPFLVNVIGSLALLEARAGCLTSAEGSAARALALASRAQLGSHPSTIDAHLAMATVLRERNQLGRAALALDEVQARAGRVRRAIPLATEVSERALLHLAASHPARGLAAIRESRGAGASPRLGARFRAVEARLLVAMAEPDRAGDLLEGDGGYWNAELSAAAVQTAVVGGDLGAARRCLEAWPPDAELRSELDRELWTAVVENLEGRRRRAVQRMADVVARAEPEGHVRLFLDAGDDAMRLLRALFRSEPTPYLGRVVERGQPVAELSRRSGGLAEALSQRELQIVRFLPTRLSSAEIADELYVSLNTLKTHLRSIYRKLGVSGRREAIEAAERLGLA